MEQQKRPFLVWVIFAYYTIAYTVGLPFALAVMMGKFPVPPEVLQVYTTSAIVFMTIQAVICLSGAYYLVLLSQRAFYLFSLSFIVSIPQLLWQMFQKNLSFVFTFTNLFGLAIGWSVMLGICYYCWRLKKKEILK